MFWVYRQCTWYLKSNATVAIKRDICMAQWKTYGHVTIDRVSTVDECSKRCNFNTKQKYKDRSKLTYRFHREIKYNGSWNQCANLWEALQKIYAWPVKFYFQMKIKTMYVYFNPSLLYTLTMLILICKIPRSFILSLIINEQECCICWTVSHVQWKRSKLKFECVI